MSVSKSLKPILIGVIVIVVLALLLVAFMVIFPEKEDEVIVESTTPVSEEPVRYVIKEDGDSLVRLKAIRPDGESLIVEYNRDENGKLRYDITPKAKFFEYNTSKFRSMMFTLSSLTAVAFVEENPEDLSIYGLDDPQYQVELTYNDGRVINLYVGDNTPVDYYYYAMTDTENVVYTIGNYLTTLIMRTELEYRDIKTFPQYTEEDIYTNITWIRLTNDQGVTTEITLDEDFSIEGNKASSNYMMLSPVISSCNDDLVQEKLLDVAATLTYGDILCDITAEQFAEYGLDNPRRFEMKDTSGNSMDLVIGGAAGNYTYAVMGEQYDAFMNGEVDEVTILTYANEAFECIKVSYDTLVNRAIWIQDIHSIESIEYNMDGEKYVMELSEYDDVTGSGVEIVRTVGKINGKDISEDNTKRIYTRTLNMRQVGELDRSIELGEAEYSIILNLRDGNSRLLEMIPLNERQYACRVDGKAEFYVYKKNIQTLLTAIERVMDDRNVSLVYNT